MTFLTAGGLRVANEQIPILLIGPLAGAKAVAIFLVATRGADLIAVILTAVNMVIGPVFARLYGSGKLAELRRTAMLAARLALATAIPVAATFILFGEPILGLVFGDEFSAGARALAILSIGQFVNAAAGSVGLLLNMTGNENFTARGYAVGVAVNLTLCLLLIPKWGIEGGAVAFAASRIVSNVLFSVWALKKINVNPTAFGRLPKSDLDP
jgi:O-antigen/teichoic acid export membrane protein